MNAKTSSLSTLVAIEWHRFSMVSPQAKSLLIAIAVIAPLIGLYENRNHLGTDVVLLTVIMGLTIVFLQLLISIGEHFVASPAYTKLYIERGVSSQATLAHAAILVAVFLVLASPSFVTLAILLKSSPGILVAALYCLLITALSVGLWHALICRAIFHWFGESVVSTFAISTLSVGLLILLVGTGVAAATFFQFGLWNTLWLTSLVPTTILPLAYFLNLKLRLGTRAQ